MVFEDGFAIGLGLAVPDSLINDHYFYISGYKGHSGIDTSRFGSLPHGSWLNGSFKGAILPSSSVTVGMVNTFFTEAFNNYKK